MFTQSTNGSTNGWLIMLYLAGDNNLSEEMVLALQDILEEQVPKGDILVAQFDPSGIGLSTQRYVFDGVDKGKQLEKYRDKKFEGETNSGSPEALANFMNWAWEKQDPRDEKLNHLLILSGHGAGTSEDFLMKDENALDALSIPELKDAFKIAQDAEEEAKRKRKKINVLGMDACFMNMGEVAYEIREFADILVAAQGLEPSFGWPYRRILHRAKERREEAALRKEPTLAMSPDEVASAIVEEYIAHYSDYDRTVGRSADLSAIRLNGPGALQGVVIAVRDLTNLLLTLDHKKVLLAHWYAQTYKFDQYVDVVDFCKQMMEEFDDPLLDQLQEQLDQQSKQLGVKVLVPEALQDLIKKRDLVSAACKRVIDAVNECIVASGVSGFAYQYSHGFSIYFPWAIVSPDYDEKHLAFVHETEWDKFLRAHVKATRRVSRFARTTTAEETLETTHFEPEPDLPEKIEATLTKLKEDCGSAHSGSTDQRKEGDVEKEIEEEIKRRLKKMLNLKIADKDFDGRLTRVLSAVARTREAGEIPFRDVPREITRRVLRGTQFADAKSRYDDDRYDDDRYDDDRYGAGTRFPSDRERAVKNLPPVIGSLVGKPKKAATVATRPITVAGA